jgi:hypothetical protein
MLRRKALPLVLLLAAFVVPTVRAQTTITLEGIVLNGQGKPV